jgi:Zn-finger nucleic acid-binding protein
MCHLADRLAKAVGAICDDSVVNCSNCGAAMELSPAQGYYVCRYCGTFHFPDSADSQGIRVLGPAEPPLACPVCASPLTVAMLDEHQVDYCGACRGMLAPRRSFAEIVRRRRSWAAGPPVTPVPPDLREFGRTLMCPKCGDPLTADRYYGPGNIIMDGCVPCDWVWLDYGELKQIVDAPGRDRGTRDPS